jgi:hypothetical protein
MKLNQLESCRAPGAAAPAAVLALEDVRRRIQVLRAGTDFINTNNT